MAFISSAFTAGQTLTAASMEDLRGNANAGHSVFTNEAARDAAITAPTEGMMAYLTAPTVPAATGATTAVPSGVVTIYDGSVWVCTTPIAAHSYTTATTTSTSYVTTLTSDSTAISVTLVTGTTALISMYVNNSFTGSVTNYLSVSVGGATSLAATDGGSQSLPIYQMYNYMTGHRTWVITGLTAGSNSFTLNYRTTGVSTVTYYHRNLTVQGIA